MKIENLLCDNATLMGSTLTTAEKCLHLTKVCAESQDTFNFVRVYFCLLDGNNWVFALFAILVIIILFKFICSTVDEFIAPAIVYLSKYLKLSQSLAGVTLLAFANGAGDVITAIVASGSPGGVSYNVGALYGAGFFVLTLVVAFTIVFSPSEIVVDKSVIFRDIGFYILATLLTIFIAYQGQITWMSSLSLLLLYIVYVLVVVLQDWLISRQKNNNTDEEETKQLVETKDGDNEANEEEDEEEESESSDEEFIQRRLSSVFKGHIHHIARLKKLSKKLHSYTDYLINRREIREQDEGLIGSLIDFIDIPFHYIRVYTMPPCEEEEYHHHYTVYWPFLGITFLFWNFLQPISLYWLIIIPLAIALFCIFRKFKGTRHEVPPYFLSINLLGILTGILWTKICCGMLVNLLSLIGIMTNLSTTYLGLTILAVGNALPDGLTTISIAKQGQAIMGLTGGIAGQLFGLLIGFGLAMFKQTLVVGHPLVFDLFNPKSFGENELDIIVIAFALVTLLFMFFYGILNGYLFDRRFSYSLICIYIALIAVTTFIAIKEVMNS